MEGPVVSEVDPLEYYTRTWVQEGLAYLSLVTEVEKTRTMGAAEVIEFTAHRDFVMMSGSDLLAFIAQGDAVSVHWLEARGRWSVAAFCAPLPHPPLIHYGSMAVRGSALRDGARE